MADIQIRDHLDRDYPDVYTPEVLTALSSLSELNHDRLAIMRKRMDRRTERGEKQQPLNFLSPDDYIPRTSIRVQDARDGKFIEQIGTYNPMLKKDNPEAFNNRGIIRRELGEYALAIQDFNFAINADPQYGYAYANRAVVKAMMGRDFEVMSDVNKAVSYGVIRESLEKTISEVEADRDRQ